MGNIIVVGCGRVGSQLATKLSTYDNNVCVIDKDPDSFANLGRDFNGSSLIGFGYDEDILIKAGIEDCDFLAAVTQNDNANLMCAEVARRLYGVPNAVARLYNAGHERAYQQLGIDYVCGTALVADEIFAKISSGHGDHIASLGEFEMLGFSLDLSATNKPHIKVRELEKSHSIRVCAFERSDGSASSLPTSDSVLYHGDSIVVAVRHDMVPTLGAYMQD